MPVPELSKIAEELAHGGQAQPVTTRTFLSWFGAQRRGYWIVGRIRRNLADAGLRTEPDFEEAYIDAPIKFTLIAPPGSGAEMTAPAGPAALAAVSVESASEESAAVITWISKDPTYRLSKLAAANQAVVSVKPDSSIQETVTLLLSRDFSQLPVMTNDRDVKGIVTWRSIGSRYVLSKPGTCAREFMEPHHEIRSTASIFDAISVVVRHQYVLVRGPDGKITGIITSSDLSNQFGVLAEPFLLLGEIENFIRVMIGDRFSNAELAAARDPADLDREIQGPADLTFGEYIRLLENPERWQKFGLAIDRGQFCKDLDHIRNIRNDVMHFDPDPLPDSQLGKLRDFIGFLKQLQSVLAGA